MSDRCNAPLLKQSQWDMKACRGQRKTLLHMQVTARGSGETRCRTLSQTVSFCKDKSNLKIGLEIFCILVFSTSLKKNQATFLTLYVIANLNDSVSTNWTKLNRSVCINGNGRTLSCSQWDSDDVFFYIFVFTQQRSSMEQRKKIMYVTSWITHTILIRRIHLLLAWLCTVDFYQREFRISVFQHNWKWISSVPLSL